jgi:carbon-monoxide dehydrogenase large subunit
VDDSGTILNPLIAEGQRQGGIAQGVAQALFEEISFDDYGNPRSANFVDYLIPSASELPSYELDWMETPTPLNALGAKGIGESGTIGAAPTVQNAVIDALSPYGITHIDLPLSPQPVWQALNATEQ